MVTREHIGRADEAGNEWDQRKRAEEASRIHQEKLQLAIHATGIGLFEWEPGTGWAQYSEEWKALLGYAADEIEDRYEEWEQRLHPEDKELVLANLQNYIQDPGGNHYAEFRMLHKDGSYHWYYGGGAFAFDAGLPGGRVLGTMQDITERKRSSEQLHALTGRLISAHEEEAKILARELHDSFGQRMAVLNMQVCELEGLVLSQPKSAVRSIRRLSDEISSIAKLVHDLSRKLHPTVLSQLGLTTALEVECSSFSQLHGVRVAFSAETVPELLPDEIALCLYRIAQESLQNIRKHARTTEASVTLHGSDSEIVMTVRDFGEGFDQNTVGGRGGLGLVSMEERVRLVRGSLSVNSRKGEGTQIEVRVPVGER